MGWSGKGRSNVSRWQDYQTGGAGGASARHAGGFRGSGRAETPRYGKSGHRASRVILWGGLAGGLVALLVAIVWNLPHPTPVIVLSVTDYAGEFAPPNAYAAEDRERLGGLLTPRGWTYRDYRVHTVPRDRNRPETIRTALAAAVKENADKEALVVYLSAHGAVDASGRAVLLAENFDPDDLAGIDDAATQRVPGDYRHWTPVRDLLTDIGANVPDQTPKFVFLDANRAPFYWQLPIGGNRFENSFAAALASAVSNANVPNLYVINSAAPGQIGWAAPELSGSVFGYYVARGLAGPADVDRSGAIMLDELVHYVREHVSRWVEKNRLATQEPVLFGLGGDEKRPQIPAVKVADASDPDLLEVLAGDEDAQPLDTFVTSRAEDDLESIAKRRKELELDELWSRHAELAPFYASASAEDDAEDAGDAGSLSAVSRHPLKWARLELLLVRAEQYLFAGQAYREKHLPGAVAEAKRILAELESPPDAPPALSFPLALQAGETGYADTAGKMTAAVNGPLPRGELNGLVPDRNPAGNGSPEPVESLFVRMLDAYLPANAELSDVLPSAVDVRLLAERTAAPADVRALPWAVAELDEASEDRRRMLEDRLFLGTEGEAQVAELRRSYDELREQYRQAAERVEGIVAAYRLRDNALASLPHLAQWHLGGLSIGAQSIQSASSSDTDRRYEHHRQQLQSVSAWREKVESLGQGLALREVDLEKGLAELASLQDSIEAIRKQFRGQARDEEQRRQAWLALQNPLLTGRDREEVRERFVAVLAQQAKSAPTDEELPPVDSAAASLGPRGGAAGASDRAVLLSAFVRRPGEGPATPPDPRDRLERQDHDARADATLYAHRRRYDEKTPALFELNRHRQYAWQAGRAVDDFWGPVPSPTAGGEPYFQQVAEEYLTAGEEEKNVRATLFARLEASRKGIAFSPTSPLRAQRLNPLEVHYPSAPLPEGKAAAWASEEFGLRAGENETQRLALSTSRPPSECQLVYGGDVATQDAKSAILTALFRGHVWRSGPFDLPIGSFRTVTWARPDYGPPRVTVLGDVKQVPYVLFILDCSASMDKADVAITLENGKVEMIKRMAAAKNALQEVVTSLARLQENKYEIGLMVYSARYGVDPPPDQRPVARRRTDLNVTAADVLNDVEVKMRRSLDGDAVTQLRTELANVTSFGITPLYHAIRQGLTQSDLAADQLMQVVVITDGEDTQQTYKNIFVRAGLLNPSFRVTTADDVEGELKKLKDRVRMDVVGLKYEGASRRVATLASDSGGRFHVASDTEELKDSIEGLLRPAQFSVRHAARSEAARPPIDLDDTWVVTEEDVSGGQEFIAQMHSVKDPPDTHFLLEGGEHLQITYRRESPNTSILTHDRYLGSRSSGQLPIVDNLVNPLQRSVAFSPRACYIAAHNPERDRSGGVVFRVSVQNHEKRDFSLRPRHVWAEIRPCLINQPPEEWPVFPFFDVKFEEGTPVPVLLFTVPEWPWDDTDATEAEILIWCSYERELDVRELPIRIGADAPEFQSLGDLGTAGRVTFDAQVKKRNDRQPFQVIVSESHNEQPMDLYSWRVQMSPGPDAARHMYYTKGNLVRHEFTFDDATVLGVEEAKILITPREALQSPQTAVAVDGRRIGPVRIRMPNR